MMEGGKKNCNSGEGPVFGHYNFIQKRRQLRKQEPTRTGPSIDDVVNNSNNNFVDKFQRPNNAMISNNNMNDSSDSSPRGNTKDEKSGPPQFVRGIPRLRNWFISSTALVFIIGSTMTLVQPQGVEALPVQQQLDMMNKQQRFVQQQQQKSWFGGGAPPNNNGQAAAAPQQQAPPQQQPPQQQPGGGTFFGGAPQQQPMQGQQQPPQGWGMPWGAAPQMNGQQPMMQQQMGPNGQPIMMGPPGGWGFYGGQPQQQMQPQAPVPLTEQILSAVVKGAMQPRQPGQPAEKIKLSLGDAGEVHVDPDKLKEYAQNSFSAKNMAKYVLPESVVNVMSGDTDKQLQQQQQQQQMAAQQGGWMPQGNWMPHWGAQQQQMPMQQQQMMQQQMAAGQPVVDNLNGEKAVDPGTGQTGHVDTTGEKIVHALHAERLLGMKTPEEIAAEEEAKRKKKKHPGFMSWNAPRILGDFLHLFGIFFLIYTMYRNQSVNGISLKTQCLFTLVVTTRYLDLGGNIHQYEAHHDGHMLYLILFKETFLLTHYVILGFFAWFARLSPDDHINNSYKDTVNVWFILIPCAVMGYLTAEKATYQWMEVFWTFSQYLESAAMIPQYVFVYRLNNKQISAERVKGVDVYIFCLGTYRSMYALNWIIREMYGDSVNFQSVLGGILQITLFVDFVMYWLTQKSFLRTLTLQIDDKIHDVADAIELKAFPDHAHKIEQNKLRRRNLWDPEYQQILGEVNDFRNGSMHGGQML